MEAKEVDDVMTMNRFNKGSVKKEKKKKERGKEKNKDEKTKEDEKKRTISRQGSQLPHIFRVSAQFSKQDTSLGQALKNQFGDLEAVLM